VFIIVTENFDILILLENLLCKKQKILPEIKGEIKNKLREKHRGNHIYMYPKTKLGIFLIFFQFITFGHCGKPKTVLKFVWNAICRN
jgi:hypothetical protein